MTPILLAICDIVTESAIVFVDLFSHLYQDRRRCVCEASGLIHARISAFQMRCQSVCHSWMVLMWARGEVCFGRKVRSEREKWFVGFCQARAALNPNGKPQFPDKFP